MGGMRLSECIGYGKMEYAEMMEERFESVYRKIWPHNTKNNSGFKDANRPEKSKEKQYIYDDKWYSDVVQGVDVKAKFFDGSIIAIQEKSRCPDNVYLQERIRDGNPSYDMLLEFYNAPPYYMDYNGISRRRKPEEVKEGEYFKATPQLHIIYYPYVDIEERWYIIITPVFRLWFQSLHESYKTRYKRPVHDGQCNFFAIPIDFIIKKCPLCVLYDSFKGINEYPYKVDR